MKIFIIGSGNVAHHMASALMVTEHNLVGYYGRSPLDHDIENLTYYSTLSEIPVSADIYILCISDDAIATVSSALPIEIRNSKIVAHTSGTAQLENALPDCQHAGVFYPLQTFTAGRKMKYSEIPFCIHGISPIVIEQLTRLASSISGAVHRINDQQRQQVHLSAVLINNFVNHLIYKAEDQLSSNKIDPAILQPLLMETFAKQRELGAYEAQTGPARREDKQTINQHLNLLEKKVDKRLYKALTKSISKTYKK